MRARIFAVLIAATVGGCGGSADETASPTTGPTATPTITHPGQREASLAEVRHRLEDAGYTPEDDAVSGTAVKALTVDGVSIVGYRSADDARSDYGRIRKVYTDEFPGRGVVRQIGARVYRYGEPRRLTATERAKFRRVVAVAEGS